MTANFEIRTPDPGRSSRRWLWSLWTWFGGLVVLCVTLAMLESVVLWRESQIGTLLTQRGYHVQNKHGWIKRLLPSQWGQSVRFWGDRIVQLDVPVNRSELEPIDDLIPQLRSLASLQCVQFETPMMGKMLMYSIEGEPPQPPLPISLKSLRRFTAELKKVGRVNNIRLTGFRKSQLSGEFVDGLQNLDVEHVTVFVSQCHRDDVLRLSAIPRLKTIRFAWCEPDADTERELQLVRPDVTVQHTPYPDSW